MKVKTAPVSDKEDVLQQGTLVKIPLDLIVSHPDIHNRQTDTNWVKELKTSIEINGLDTPLLVWNGGKDVPLMKVKGKEHPSSFLIAGSHRREALRQIFKENEGKFTKMFPDGVPCVIRDGDLKDALCAQIRENANRKDAPAEAILPVLKQLRDDFNMKQSEIAKKVGKSQPWVSQIFEIEENLGEEGTEEVTSGGVSLKDAKEAAAEVKAGKTDPKTAIAKAKAKTADRKAAGRVRDEKRTGARAVYARFKALPSMKMGAKLDIAEKALAYLAKEAEELPAELQTDPETTEETAED